MNDFELLQAQVERETNCVEEAQKKFRKDTAKNERNANASNNIYGVSLKRDYLGEMIKELHRQTDNIKSTRQGYKVPERYAILSECLGVVFKRYKGEKIPNLIELFDEELACHIAFQVTLDAVMLPNTISRGKKTTKVFNGVRPAKKELQFEIATQLWRQLQFRLLDLNFSKYFNSIHDKARGSDRAKSSPHYVFNTLDWHIEQFREHCRHDERDLVFSFKEWLYPDKQVIGSWLLSLVHATGLFKLVPCKNKPREKTLELSDKGKNAIETINQMAEGCIALPLPMIIPPAPITQRNLGGWIKDSAVLNTPTNHSWKGSVELSEKHLEFYNHQQNQAFRINRFTYEILTKLLEENQQLGKFKAYKKRSLIEMWRELGINQYDWERASNKVEQDTLIHADKDKFKSVCKARSKRYNDEMSKYMEGRTSEYLYEMATKSLDNEKLYIPIEPDFRSRFTCRTSYLSYQGNDVARALLEFSKGHKIDSETKRFLSIHLANQAGLDKETYSTRIEWVERHLNVIKAVAEMTENDWKFNEGVALIKEFAEDEFQFASACREYYELFIINSKNETHLPCAIDATCSGQQLIAGFLRSGELAERVNVLPTNKPGDIYRDTMDKLLELVKNDGGENFESKTLKALKGSIGRKVSKKGFMSGQYGSGTKRQLEDMFLYIEETDLKLSDTDKVLIKKYWSLALEDVCKLRVVFNWFKDLVEEIHDAGGKEVIIPTPTGSIIHQRYPSPKTVKIKTFSFGSSEYRQETTNTQIPGSTVNTGKWKTATCANTIHGAGDASLICLALFDFKHPFYCVHDSIASHCGKPMEELQSRLKEAYVEVVSFPLWDAIREANGLPENDAKLPALCEGFNLELVKESKYLFC